MTRRLLIDDPAASRKVKRGLAPAVGNVSRSPEAEAVGQG
jgi:hypothetical protein